MVLIGCNATLLSRGASFKVKDLKIDMPKF
jgi:hypothetical protein